MPRCTRQAAPMHVDPDTLTIDTGFHRSAFDACYLLIDGGRAAFFDCGINASQPYLLAALEAHGLDVDAVDHVILSHVHLDHAGGAGSLMQVLPNATLHVHPRGARHLIDPSVLYAGASAVYGEQAVRETYGELLPVDPGRVRTAEDGTRIRVGRRELVCLDAPGHARHHIVLHDPERRVCFTGDAFGISYRELDSARGHFIFPTTTPVQFEPEAMRATVDRIERLGVERACLTHYGPVGPLPALADALRAGIDVMVRIAKACVEAADREKALVAALDAALIAAARAHGGGVLPESALRAVLAMDIQLNAQGLAVWLDRGAPGG